MLLVVIETPFAAPTKQELADNIEYLNACIMDSLYRGESPFATHRFWPGLLDDDNRAERALGIKAGLDWASRADLCAVYMDRGVSPGMKLGIQRHEAHEIPIIERRLGRQWEKDPKTSPPRIKRVK